jgi:hypothetical protein
MVRQNIDLFGCHMGYPKYPRKMLATVSGHVPKRSERILADVVAPIFRAKTSTNKVSACLCAARYFRAMPLYFDRL